MKNKIKEEIRKRLNKKFKYEDDCDLDEEDEFMIDCCFDLFEEKIDELIKEYNRRLEDKRLPELTQANLSGMILSLRELKEFCEVEKI